MANFANLDVTIERKGMQNSSKLDREIWAEFFADPDVFWTGLAAQAETYPFPMGQDQIEFGFREGLDYVVSAKARKNQDYFRDMILATYDDKCCITGIALPDLLVASHIVPWSQNRKLRTDPRNGLCLNALHDKAFDRGFISLDTDYRLIVGSKLKRFKYPIFNTHEGKKISLPKRFRPSQDCLEEHRKMHRQTLR
jgi:predicted restriction endonuclease